MKQGNRTNRMKRITNGILCAAVIAGIIILASYLAVRATATGLDESELATPMAKEFTIKEAELIAKTVWGEARGCSDVQKAAVAWCILNRVDSPRFPDSITGVVTSPGQFMGYSPSNPLDSDIFAIVVEALRWWTVEEMIPAEGWRILPREYLYFSGNGRENIFTTEYMGGTIWVWPGESDG